jgi:molybdopterin-binding protein
MSQIKAIITRIDSVESLNIVTFDFHGIALNMMSLDLSEEIGVGRKVILAVKPSHIAIAKEFSGIVSYSNQLKATIHSCNNGKLLSSIKLRIEDVMLESIITLDSVLKMDLKAGDEVTAMIKASELSIVEVLDD